jgi:uncharacterized metal-binding protein YceD (DUF177 family)
MSENELVRMVKLRPLPGDTVIVEADTKEREALAQRFGLPAVVNLRADLTLEKDGKAVLARGKLTAQISQICAISGEEFDVAIDEPILMRFVEAQSLSSGMDDEKVEIELSYEDCDEIEYSGDTFDLGEAIAQSLGLAIDPYAEGPNANEAREEAGIAGDDEPSGPLAEALKALKPE